MSTKMIEKGICCVADQFCKAAANFEPPMYVKTKCFSCGDFVCVNCSIVITKYYNYGKQRLCHTCLAEYQDTNQAVMAHLQELAK